MKPRTLEKLVEELGVAELKSGDPGLDQSGLSSRGGTWFPVIWEQWSQVEGLSSRSLRVGKGGRKSAGQSCLRD